MCIMWVVSPKRKNTNKLNASHDLLFIIQSNANEEEFKQIFSDFITENGEFKRWEFSFISIKTVLQFQFRSTSVPLSRILNPIIYIHLMKGMIAVN